MDWVITRAGEEQLTEGLSRECWRYRVVRILSSTAQGVIGLVEYDASENSTSNEPLFVSYSKKGDSMVYLAKRVNDSDTGIAGAEARLWACAAEQEPRLFLKLVEFVPIHSRSFIYVYEYCPKGLAPLHASEAKIWRLLAHAFAALKVLRECGIPTQGRVRCDELFANGKLRGFGPSVVFGKRRLQEAVSQKFDGSEGSGEQSPEEDIYELGILLRSLMGGDTNRYSNKMKRLLEGCLRDAAHLRPDMHSVERRIYRMIQKKKHASEEEDADPNVGLGDAPVVSELSEANSTDSTACQLEDIIHSIELQDVQTEGNVKVVESLDRNARLADKAQAPMKPSTTTKSSRSASLVSESSDDGYDEALTSQSISLAPMEEVALSMTGATIETTIRKALGSEKSQDVQSMSLQILLTKVFTSKENGTSDKIYETLRREILRHSLDPVFNLKTFYIIHVLLLRGPRTLYASADRYMNFLNLMRGSATDRLNLPRRDQVRDRSESHDQKRSFARSNEDSRFNLQSLNPIDLFGLSPRKLNGLSGGLIAPGKSHGRQCSALLSLYGGLIIGKVRTFLLSNSRNTSAPNERPLGQRMNLMKKILGSVHIACDLAIQVLPGAENPTLASLSTAILEELWLEVVVSIRCVCHDVAPFLEPAESIEASNLLVEALDKVRHLYQSMKCLGAGRSSSPARAALRRIAPISMKCLYSGEGSGVDDRMRGICASVTAYVSDDARIGCGTHFVRSCSELSPLHMHIFAPPRTGTSKPSLSRLRTRSQSVGASRDMSDSDGSPRAPRSPVPRSHSSSAPIPFDELEIASEIGRGSFGMVYKARLGAHIVAVKIMSMGINLEQSNVLREFYSEVSILRELQHENVLRFFGAGLTPDRRPYIVTEYMTRGTLFDLLHRKREMLSPLRKKSMALDICRGMAYLHAKCVLHRDLKSANLLVNEAYRVKVGDFGLARRDHHFAFAPPMTGQCGTFQYMAPEVMRYEMYDQSADVFSFGVLLWEMLTGQLPYQGMQPAQVVVAIVNRHVRPEMNPNWSADLRRLLGDCWHEDPRRRPTFLALAQRLPPVPFP